MSVVAIAAVGVVGACSGNDSNKPDILKVDDSDVGLCLDFADDAGPTVNDLPTIDCTEPHTHEIFGVALSKAETYPGFEALETEAQAACLAKFQPYVGTNPFDSELFYSWLVPTLESWQEGDRQIICVAANTNGAPLPPGTIKGSNR